MKYKIYLHTFELCDDVKKNVNMKPINSNTADTSIVPQ